MPRRHAERAGELRKRTCEAELGMCLDGGYDATEHRRRHNVHFVQQDEAPLARRQEVHHLLRLVRPVVCVCDHGVRRYHDAAIARKLAPI